MNTWIKRTVAGLGAMATVIGVHWSIQAAPAPEDPASAARQPYAEADRTTRITIERLEAHLPALSQQAAQATRSVLTAQNALQQAVAADQHLNTLEATEAAHLVTVQAQWAAAASSVTTPAVHTVTGASGGGGDDGGGDGGGDDGGGDGSGGDD